MKLTKLFKDFFESEKTGGLLLIFCTALSLILANSDLQSDYLNLWKHIIGTGFLGGIGFTMSIFILFLPSMMQVLSIIPRSLFYLHHWRREQLDLYGCIFRLKISCS
jgi:Na+/H+ antiporter NhaA